MQSRHYKRLLPLAAVALLILAFLVIEMDETPGPCERSRIQAEEGRKQLATPNPEYLKEYREMSDLARAIRPKYRDLFWRQPNVWSTSIGFFKDENGNYIEVPDGEGGCKWVVGFVIRVTKRVVQDTLPPEDRIPAALGGIPVQILEDPYVITPDELWWSRDQDAETTRAETTREEETNP